MFPESSMPTGINNATSVESAANGQAEEEQVAVDPNQKVEVADQSKDINTRIPPPTGGKEYIVQWELGEKGVEYRASKKSGTFIVVPLVGHLVLEGSEYNGYQIVDWINSIYNKLVGTTAVHDFLYKVGVTVPPTATQADLKALMESTLAQKPMGTIELEWRASMKNPADPRANKDGYVTVANKMRFFPKNPDGSYRNYFENKIDGSEVFAQAYVAQHLRR